ncbi:MAG: M1 family metallopeptidase [Acidobacteriota bacterium]
MSLRPFFLATGLFWAGCFTPVAASSAPPIASYHIQARLEPATRTVSGRETLTWRNHSGDTITELAFHLYMNAFKNEKSTFLRESEGSLRGFRLREGEWGWIDIHSLRLAGGSDLTDQIRFVHPDDDNQEDRTVIKVALEEPVAPGGTLRLEIEFETRLPHVFARTGYHADFFMVGQWFPKIGVWEAAGERYATRGQWNCHQFHANSEFYADYGRYRVELTVPDRFVVGATGVLTSSTSDSEDSTATYTYEQDDVHDFAWTAFPRFLRVEREFRAEREVSARELAEVAARLQLPEEKVRLHDVRMILLMQPEHGTQVERHFRALSNAIKCFGLWYGAYPYRTITLVDPPYGAGGAGGMEYPTLITAGTSLLVNRRGFGPEGVIIHEFGHQFWYGLVGSNEFEESWLDEGFTTYSSAKVMDLVYGPMELPARIAGLPLNTFFHLPTLTQSALNRLVYIHGAQFDSLVRNAWDYLNGSSYGINSYMRAGVILETLERLLGEDIMARVMRIYHQRWRFRHPTTRDFIEVVNEVSCRDMSPFFEQAVYSANEMDYAVATVTNRKVRAAKGVFEREGKKITVNREEAGKEDKKKKSPDYRSEVVLRRLGEMVMPVEIVITFDDGRRVDKAWDGRYRWVKYRFQGASRITSVDIDPERKLLFDVNFRNNSYRLEAHRAAEIKWLSRFLFDLQNLLQYLAMTV